MNLILKLRNLKYYHLDWLILLIGSAIIRLIGINFGLPFEHYGDEEYVFGNVDNTIASGSFYPGIYNYGYIFYYITHFLSLLARFTIDTTYIREYEILFTKVFIVILASATILIFYEISRRLYNNRFWNLATGIILALAICNITLSRYVMADHLIAFLLSLIILSAIIYIKTRSKKSLYGMFILTGICVSTKLSYSLLFTYPVFIYLLVRGFKMTKRKIKKLIFLSGISVLFYALGNIFEIFNLYSWIGRNVYFIKAYNTSNYFYFKDIHENYFDHLSIIITFLSSDFYIVTGFSILITLSFLILLIIQGWRFYKKDKKLFLSIIAFPIALIILLAKAKVFQMRTLLPIAPLFLIVILYPPHLSKFKDNLIKLLIIVIIFIFFINSLSVVSDVYKHNAEKQVMNFIDKNQSVFALPYAFQFPSLEYAYYSPESKLDLLQYKFFIENNNKIIYYQKNNNFNEILDKSDYFIIMKQLLQELDYHKYNLLRMEPLYEAIDMKSEDEIFNLLNKYNFKLLDTINSSDYETITKYDSANLGLKHFLLYKKYK